jgi:hypothetical protein
LGFFTALQTQSLEVASRPCFIALQQPPSLLTLLHSLTNSARTWSAIDTIAGLHNNKSNTQSQRAEKTYG